MFVMHCIEVGYSNAWPLCIDRQSITTKMYLGHIRIATKGHIWALRQCKDIKGKRKKLMNLDKLCGGQQFDLGRQMGSIDCGSTSHGQ